MDKRPHNSRHILHGDKQHLAPPDLSPTHLLIAKRLQKILSRLSTSSSSPLPDIFASDFHPIPKEVAGMQYVNAWPAVLLSTLDIHAMPMEAEAFIFGLLHARNAVVENTSDPFAPLHSCLLTPQIQDLKDILMHKKKIKNVEKVIEDHVKLYGGTLEDATIGYHIGRIISNVAIAWKTGIQTCDSVTFFKSQLRHVENEVELFLTSISWLTRQDDETVRHSSLCRFIRGTLFGRLQHTAFIVELILTWLDSEEILQSKYQAGLITWQVGWFTAPRKVADLVHDIIEHSMLHAD
jgi:hypothetical protein